MAHVWKIGQFAEITGTRILVYDVTEQTVAGFAVDGTRHVMFKTHPGLKPLPHCDSWTWTDKPEIPPLPEGYRLLGDDEIVAEGDLTTCVNGGWVKAASSIGKTVSDNNRTNVIYLYYARKELQLREGAYYERRDGEIVGPAEPFYDDDTYPWRVGIEQYTDSGTWWASKKPHDLDLIREVKPLMRPFADAAEFAPFRDKWITCGGTEFNRINVFNNQGVFYDSESSIITYQELFDDYVFVDFVDGDYVLSKCGLTA